MLLVSGWWGKPVSARLRLRRSTAVLLATFIVLGVVYLWVTPM